jgi:hypothetical protein
VQRRQHRARRDSSDPVAFEPAPLPPRGFDGATIVDVTASRDVLVAAVAPAARHVLTTGLTHRFELVVRGIACRCPQCGLDGVAVAVIHPDFGLPEVSAVVDAEGGMELAFAKELLEEIR